MENTFLYIMDITGTVAFAVSGCMLAVKKKMDLLGVMILGIVTAVGGGCLRDLIIGRTPPVMFQDETFVAISALTSVLYFVLAWLHAGRFTERHPVLSEEALFWTDSLGLGAFTVDGVIAGITFLPEGGMFLHVVLGVLTGVGGGILRDVLAQETPSIFVRHIYACASIAGAVLTELLYSSLPVMDTILLGFSCVVIVRFLSMHFRWNLPRMK